MTLKTSFFNKAVFKSLFRRYMWGSILYFVCLFVSTSMVFLLSGSFFYDLADDESGILLSAGSMLFPMLLAIVVPSVTAPLVFKYLHSKNMAVFVHSLPVSRKTNYISVIAAAFSLMFLPVIANGVIIMLMEASGFISLGSGECFMWMLYNILALFMMFSCAAFSSCITGNAFGAIVINIVLHLFPAILVMSFNNMADTFLLGFTDNNVISEAIISNSFIVVIWGFVSENFRDNLTVLPIMIYVLSSLVLYGLSFVLCVKRKAETASDVAGFKCLNHIFKYSLAFIVVMFTFAVFSGIIDDVPLLVIGFMGVSGIVVYTASEMILKKTLNVIYAWKGFVLFALAVTVLMSLFAFTSFFGYETRMPEPDKIEAVMICEDGYADDEWYSTDEDVINLACDIHREIVQECGDEVFRSENYRKLAVCYEMKNGSLLRRSYRIDEKYFFEIMDRLYKNIDYKKAAEKIFMDDKRICYIDVQGCGYITRHKEFLDAVRKDILSMSYKEIEDSYMANVEYMIEIEYLTGGDGSNSDTELLYLYITENYVNTLSYLDKCDFGNN